METPETDTSPRPVLPDNDPLEPEPETPQAYASRRVIFLDVDGVLANSRSQLIAGCVMDYEDEDPTLIHDASNSVPTPLERRCVDELSRIVQATGASIVLSTTWRLDEDMRSFLVNCLAPLPVIGDTPSISGSVWGNNVVGQRRKLHGRGAEITAWLKGAEGGVQSFVILDDGHRVSFDDAGLSPFYIQTWMGNGTQGHNRDKEGLTKELADAAIAILLQPKEGLSELPPDADTSLLSTSRQVTLVGHRVVVGATRDHVEYTFEVTGVGAGAETFNTRFSHAKNVHDQLFAEGALDRLADASLSFPTHWADALKDMNHDEANVQRRGEELQAYYRELFQKHGEAIGHKSFLPTFRKAMAMAKALPESPQS